MPSQSDLLSSEQVYTEYKMAAPVGIDPSYLDSIPPVLACSHISETTDIDQLMKLRESAVYGDTLFSCVRVVDNQGGEMMTAEPSELVSMFPYLRSIGKGIIPVIKRQQDLDILLETYSNVVNPALIIVDTDTDLDSLVSRLLVVSTTLDIIVPTVDFGVTLISLLLEKRAQRSDNRSGIGESIADKIGPLPSFRIAQQGRESMIGLTVYKASEEPGISKLSCIGGSISLCRGIAELMSADQFDGNIEVLDRSYINGRFPIRFNGSVYIFKNSYINVLYRELRKMDITINRRGRDITLKDELDDTYVVSDHGISKLFLIYLYYSGSISRSDGSYHLKFPRQITSMLSQDGLNESDVNISFTVEDGTRKVAEVFSKVIETMAIPKSLDLEDVLEFPYYPNMAADLDLDQFIEQIYLTRVSDSDTSLISSVFYPMTHFSSPLSKVPVNVGKTSLTTGVSIPSRPYISRIKSPDILVISKNQLINSDVHSILEEESRLPPASFLQSEDIDIDKLRMSRSRGRGTYTKKELIGFARQIGVPASGTKAILVELILRYLLQ